MARLVFPALVGERAMASTTGIAARSLAWFVLLTWRGQCSRGFLSRLKEAIRQFCPFDGAGQLKCSDEGRINA